VDVSESCDGNVDVSWDGGGGGEEMWCDLSETSENNKASRPYVQ